MPETTHQTYPPKDRLTVRQAAEKAREAAKARLFQKLRDGELNAIALENSDQRRTDPRIFRRARKGHVLPGPLIGPNAGVQRRFSLEMWLFRYCRAHLNSITPETLSELASRADSRGDGEGAEYWRNTRRHLEAARSVPEAIEGRPGGPDEVADPLSTPGSLEEAAREAERAAAALYDLCDDATERQRKYLEAALELILDGVPEEEALAVAGRTLKPPLSSNATRQLRHRIKRRNSGWNIAS